MREMARTRLRENRFRTFKNRFFSAVPNESEITKAACDRYYKTFFGPTNMSCFIAINNFRV